jgi:hypothetical protein
MAEKNKSRKGKITDNDLDEAPTQHPVVVGDVVLVNGNKVTRAKNIVELVSGRRTPLDQSEAELKERWSRHFANGEHDPKATTAVQFVYEKLGGLVRTKTEQEEADVNAADAKRQMKKRKIEEDK